MLGGFIRAIGAGKEAKRLQKQADAINPVRPEYEIPQEIRQSLELAYNNAQGDMPGFSRMIAQTQDRTANTLGNARNFADSGSSLLQNLALAGENERSATADINVMNQQFKQSGFNGLQRSLGQMAGYQDQEFQFNEVEPFIQESVDKRAFQEAANNQRNAKREGWASLVDGVINTGLAVATAPIGSGGGSMFGKLFGGKKAQSNYAADQATKGPAGIFNSAYNLMGK